MPTSLPRPTVPRRVRLLATSALLLAVMPLAGCGSSGGSGSGSGADDADPAAVIPADAPLYAEYVLRPQGAQKASVKTLAQKIGRTDDPGAKIIAAVDKALKDDGKTFKDDIDPWLGQKIGVALTGVKNPEKPDYVIVVDASDTKKALEALKTKSTTLEERTYKDVTYLYSGNREMARAAIGDTIVVGTESGVKGTIDVDQGAKALADAAKLKQARKAVTSDRLAFVYANPTGIIDLFARLGTAAQKAQLGQLKPYLKAAKDAVLGGALTTTPNTIRMETSVSAPGAKQSGGDQTASAQRLAALPASSTIAVGLGDIGTSFEKSLAQMKATGSPYASGLSQFKTVTGIDLQQDVLSWMGAGGFFFQAESIANVGGALVVDTKDPKKTTAFIKTLDRLITQYGSAADLTVSPYRRHSVTGIQIKTKQIPFPIIIATGGGSFVIAVGETSLTNAIKPTQTLADDPQFQTTTKQLGVAPTVYANLQHFVKLLDLAATGDTDAAKVQPYLEAFRALAIGSEVSGTTTKGSLIVTVK